MDVGERGAGVGWSLRGLRADANVLCEGPLPTEAEIGQFSGEDALKTLDGLTAYLLKAGKCASDEKETALARQETWRALANTLRRIDGLFECGEKRPWRPVCKVDAKTPILPLLLNFCALHEECSSRPDGPLLDSLAELFETFAKVCPRMNVGHLADFFSRLPGLYSEGSLHPWTRLCLYVLGSLDQGLQSLSNGKKAFIMAVESLFPVLGRLAVSVAAVEEGVRVVSTICFHEYHMDGVSAIFSSSSWDAVTVGGGREQMEVFPWPND